MTRTQTCLTPESDFQGPAQAAKQQLSAGPSVRCRGSSWFGVGHCHMMRDIRVLERMGGHGAGGGWVGLKEGYTQGLK